MSIWSACPDTCRAWSSRLVMIADVGPAFCGEHCLGKVMATEFIYIYIYQPLPIFGMGLRTHSQIQSANDSARWVPNHVCSANSHWFSKPYIGAILIHASRFKQGSQMS